MQFSVGQRVHHEIFGDGTVTSIQGRNGQQPDLITVKFDKGTAYVSPKDDDQKTSQAIKEQVIRKFLSTTEKLTEKKK